MALPESFQDQDLKFCLTFQATDEPQGLLLRRRENRGESNYTVVWESVGREGLSDGGIVLVYVVSVRTMSELDIIL